MTPAALSKIGLSAFDQVSCQHWHIMKSMCNWNKEEIDIDSYRLVAISKTIKGVSVGKPLEQIYIQEN